MGTYRTLRRSALPICALLVVLLVVGCAGIEPYKPRDYREEGPEKGLFTGSKGEWVILGPKVPQIGKKDKDNGNPETEPEHEEKTQPEK